MAGERAGVGWLRVYIRSSVYAGCGMEDTFQGRGRGRGRGRCSGEMACPRVTQM